MHVVSHMPPTCGLRTLKRIKFCSVLFCSDNSNYQDYSNDELRLTFIYFMERSNIGKYQYIRLMESFEIFASKLVYTVVLMSNDK